MADFVTFKLRDSSTVAAEVDDRPQQTYRGGSPGANVLAESGETFQAAISTVRKAAEEMLDGLRSLVTPADELSLEFGIKLTAEAGAVIAKASADAHFVVKLKWSKAPGGVQEA